MVRDTVRARRDAVLLRQRRQRGRRAAPRHRVRRALHAQPPRAIRRSRSRPTRRCSPRRATTSASTGLLAPGRGARAARRPARHPLDERQLAERAARRRAAAREKGVAGARVQRARRRAAARAGRPQRRRADRPHRPRAGDAPLHRAHRSATWWRHDAVIDLRGTRALVTRRLARHRRGDRAAARACRRRRGRRLPRRARRTPRRWRRRRAALGVRAVACAADLATRDGADALVEAAVDAFGGVDFVRHQRRRLAGGGGRRSATWTTQRWRAHDGRERRLDVLHARAPRRVRWATAAAS